MRLFIDYFTPNERKGNKYIKAIKSINPNDIHLVVNNKVEFLTNINDRNLNEVTHLTILTHGVKNVDFICKDEALENAISYCELVNALNSTSNGNNIILNLAVICKSHRVDPFVKLLDKRFSEIWVTEEETPYLEVPIKMVYFGFDYFTYDKDEEDIFYKQLLNSN